MAQQSKEEDEPAAQAQDDDCKEEFKVQDEFIARSVSFFGNKDIKTLWQRSNFVASKDLRPRHGKFDFSEFERKDEKEEGKEEDEEEEEGEEDDDMGKLFGSYDDY